jgi:Pectate lyase superfamily protein
VGAFDRSCGAACLFACLATVSPTALGQGFITPSPIGPACAGEPWMDVRCYGATGDDRSDDSAAFARALRAALAAGAPLLLSPGTYRLGQPLVVDYAARAETGFRLISMGAVLDSRDVAHGPVLEVTCSGGNPTAPKGCFYFKEEGTLLVYANTNAYAVEIGRSDFGDAQNSIKIDHLVVNNGAQGPRSGGLQLNYVLDAEIFAVADTAGGAAGIALEQTQFSRLAGAGSASAPGGAALLIENGYSFADTIEAIDLEAAPTCLVIAAPSAAHNTFVSPYLACPTAVDAAAGNGTILLNPLFAGNVTTKFAATVGVATLP